MHQFPVRWKSRPAVTIALLVFLMLFYFVINNNHEISNSSTSSAKHFHSSKYDGDNVRMKIPMCDCWKWIPKSSKVDNGLNDFFNRSYVTNDTTCASETFVRGPGQKTFSFLYFEQKENATKITPPGTHIDIINWQSKLANYLSQADADDEEVVEHRMEERKIRGYLDGIRENFELVKRYYPDYTMRLYADLGGPIGAVNSDSMAKSALCDLACKEPNFDICDIYSIPKLGNASVLYPLLWRFLPAIDRQVDIFFSRDLDSRISEREVAAVNEFLESDSNLHVMRDHPAHGAFVMGGLWGAKVVNMRKDLILAFKDMFADGVSYFKKENGFGYDQHILTRYIWHWAKRQAMAHDSYTCTKFSGTRPFPTRRKEFQVGNYVGSIVRLNASTEAECPEKCRPKNHKDWKKC